MHTWLFYSNEVGLWSDSRTILIQSTLFTTTLFVPKKIDVKLNFCCNEFKFKLNWCICANTTDVVKNFAVIKNVAVKSFHCMSNLPKWHVFFVTGCFQNLAFIL